ncbi:MAG: hypothetical protein ACU84J_13705 [Gammaproteobacteria bacterium]
MKTTTLSKKLPGLFISALLLSGANSAPADEQEIPIAPELLESMRLETEADEKSSIRQLSSDGEVEFDGTIIADMRLATGTRVVFVDLVDGVGAYEQVPPGAPSLAEFPALRGAPMVDLFLAMSEPNTPVPEAIKKYSKPSRHIGRQGWIHDAVRLGQFDLPRANCTNSTFSDAVVSKGYDDRGTPVLRLDQRVGFTGNFVAHTECFGTGWVGGCPTFYRYEPVSGTNGSIFPNVDKYYTRVAVCGLGNHPTITSNYGTTWVHPGPVLDIDYRDSNNNGYYSAVHEDFTESDVGGVRAWHYTGGTNHWNYDWRTRITLSKVNDYFDIGHAVEDLGY